MFKVLAFLSRKPGVSREAFREYYETRHVPLVNEVAPRMQAYRRNYLVFGEPLSRSDDMLDFDVVTEMEFPDRAAFETWIAAFRAPGATERIAADEENFIDRSRIRTCVVEISSN
jgi:uncharacterized protein (TIGR02118 family)